jgi:hypothetical protein
VDGTNNLRKAILAAKRDVHSDCPGVKLTANGHTYVITASKEYKFPWLHFLQNPKITAEIELSDRTFSRDSKKSAVEFNFNAKLLMKTSKILKVNPRSLD